MSNKIILNKGRFVKGQHRSPKTEFKKGSRPSSYRELPLEEIANLYVAENKSCTEIAKIYDVDHKKILRCLNESGIPRKERGFFIKGKHASEETKSLLSSLKKGKPQPQLQTAEARRNLGIVMKEVHKGKTFGWESTHNKILKNGGTDSELYFESLLKGANITGYVRELIVRTGKQGRYSIDFAFPEQKLAIELDGDSHLCRKKHDEKRDVFLTSLGWKVKRVLNSELFNTPDGVINSLKELLGV